MNHYEVMETWIAQARTGDPDAKLRLLTAYRPLILSMVTKYVYDQALWEDSVQDGCLIFLEAVETYQPGAGAGARMLRQEDSARLRAALETLTDDQRRVIDDYYVKGLDWAEIAARQQVKLGTVCSRMNRALKRLQEAFEVEDT